MLFKLRIWDEQPPRIYKGNIIFCKNVLRDNYPYWWGKREGDRIKYWKNITEYKNGGKFIADLVEILND